MHRLILGLKLGDGKRVDHTDGNGLDNRRANLRLTTFRENAVNTRRRRQGRTASRFPGVSSTSGGGEKWQAHIRCQGRLIHLGVFASEYEAGAVYAATSALLGELHSAAEQHGMPLPGVAQLKPWLKRVAALASQCFASQLRAAERRAVNGAASDELRRSMPEGQSVRA